MEQPEAARKNPVSQVIQVRVLPVILQAEQAGKLCWHETQVLVRVFR